MSTDHSYEHDDVEYGRKSIPSKKRTDETERSSRPLQGRRRGKSPQSVNGIHRRRRRKMSW